MKYKTMIEINHDGDWGIVNNLSKYSEENCYDGTYTIKTFDNFKEAFIYIADLLEECSSPYNYRYSGDERYAPWKMFESINNEIRESRDGIDHYGYFDKDGIPVGLEILRDSGNWGFNFKIIPDSEKFKMDYYF